MILFSSSKIKVAGKTGTAEETGKPDFGWFAGYAPYEDPQIEIVCWYQCYHGALPGICLLWLLCWCYRLD